MTLTVFLAVLAAAAMHATWNALIKVRSDRFASISLASLGMAVFALPVLPFVEVPALAVWPWIATSMVIHVGYRLFLILAYSHGDLAQTYPLARGTAPLMTTIGGIALFSEMPGPLAIAGILFLCFGTLLMSFRGNVGVINRRAVGFALTTSVFVAGYTLTDGSGARLATTASSYAAWLFLCDGVVSMAIGFFYRGRQLLTAMRQEWKIGILTGFLSAGSYWIAMWAMTKAPIASVAALRETSILFAMVISVTMLGESMTRWRVAAALSIIFGVIALRVG
ncbi:EamA family transporter [Mesorhizobium sp. NBSH29]|uniref:EamA family transporter n=1 Tax=Mesorhizobium sp. NBSH29 TaxID=2654249 RepID=UPI001896617A|nr:EamA family transporter [Mesorhizobium sp. NBSH29]QPC85491.1 EamA family transporter [Mesorhizobium sp. NBSH29]